MSDSQRTTRRSLLQTGGIAAIAAGLLGTTSAPTVAAEPLPLPNALPTVVSTVDLDADCDRLLADLKREDAAYWAADAALEATMTPGQIKLYHTLSDAESDRRTTYHEWISAEMARHAPGLSTVIRLLWLHAIAECTNDLSACCRPATGYDL
jgi:hypothetical protein